MKFIGAAILIVGLILGAAYIGGVFNVDADIKITINKSIKKDAVEFTTETIKKTKQSTDRVFEQLQQKLEEQIKGKE